MTYNRQRLQLLRLLTTAGALFAVALFAGCGGGPTVVSEVSGVITINGKPYPNVKVSFYPQDENLDASFVATGTTDGTGAFQLTMSGERIGCAATGCKVIVVEPPVPDQIRMDLENGDGNPAAYNNYKKSLKFRPIPSQYTRLKSTPLTADVSEKNKSFEFKLSR